MIDKINKVIEEKIRPRLQQHNGDVKFVDEKDGLVRLKLLGSCSNCAAAQDTLEQFIEVVLKNEINEVEKVEIINVISQDLIDMARTLLKH